MQKLLGKIYGMEKLPFQDLLRFPCYLTKASLVAQMVKRLPTTWETQVRSLRWEDPLEKEMATHSSTLAWKIPWLEERGGLQSTGCKESGTTERLTHTRLYFTSFFKFIRQNDIAVQFSCSVVSNSL